MDQEFYYKIVLQEMKLILQSRLEIHKIKIELQELMNLLFLL